jgi:hypothetical protein
MSAIDPKRASGAAYNVYLELLRCLVVSLGGGNETAKALGLGVPTTLLTRADEVIE